VAVDQVKDFFHPRDVRIERWRADTELLGEATSGQRRLILRVIQNLKSSVSDSLWR
jgi:hypothetical protein